tara:strand:+ start:170 stop:370 length:201 start_codon:yes stop_codon:yes gene_type:complete
MKKYKLTIIENIISGTLTKTMEIEAKNEEEAEEIFMECANNGDWDEDYDNLEFGDPESNIEEIKDE